jgi:hypothetical protein
VRELSEGDRLRVVTTRCLALRAAIRVGGKPQAWQFRWAIEPLLADYTVRDDEAAMAEAASGRTGRPV